MDEISELLYQLLATILVCIGLSIVLLQQDNLTDIQKHAKEPIEKVSFSEYGFGADKNPDMISGDELRAHIMSNRTCDVYIDDTELAAKNSNIIGILDNITGDYYSVYYQFNETGEIISIAYKSQ